MKRRSFVAAFATLAFSASAGFSLDLELSPYKPVMALSGALKSVGSDTMLHEMELWAEGFKAYYPNVTIEIEGKGSNTAPPALLSGQSQLGPMSRQMTPDEIAGFEAKFGYKPRAVLVAVDALAIYVHKDNPIQCLTLEQLNRLFAERPKSADGKSAQKWGDVGVTGEWVKRPIAAYGRNALSGTNKFFKQHVLDGGDFKESVHQEQGSEAVVRAVANDPGAIGYSGIGYKTADVRAVPVAASFGKTCYDSSFENTYTRKYPLARGLYVYLMKDPKAPMDTLSAEFVKYILSREGQAQAKKGGYYPITRNIREHELTRLGLLASAE